MRFDATTKSQRKLSGQPTGSNPGTHSKNREDLAPNIGVIIVALLAMAIVQMFRSGHSRSVAILVTETVLFSALPWIAYWILQKRPPLNFKLFGKASISGFQAGAIVVGMLVVIWHFLIRQLGFGDPTEVVALLTLQSVCWYLAVFSKVPGFEKASSILSGALVFFVCCMADDWRIFLLAGLFAFAGLWWMIGQYWNRLETKAIDGHSRSLKLQGSAVSLTMLIVLLVACMAAAIPFSKKGIARIGFSPFSGGEKGSQNEFAISGVGDGNMLTAGENATTTGAVESDQFIEDDKPSLYDITTERYEGPIVRKLRNKSISLAGNAKHIHDAKKSEQSGRTFRTMRDSGETIDLKLEDRITEALFFVEGSVPARFSISNFNQFDGWDWSAVPNDSDFAKPPPIILRDQNGDPVFRLGRSIAGYLTGRRLHRVKIMRLESSAVPASALVQQWHIPLVNRPDMFCWGETDLLEMDADAIPSHSIIDVQSLVPNYFLLRDLQILQPTPTADAGRAFLQVPTTEAQPKIKALANQWTEGIQPGWLQVEAIVNHLRNDFELNPNWETDDDIEDSVDLFLEQGGGPSYMFATACAMALRSAGYKTRMASGFLVQQKDYDSQARQSVVTSENLHMWPEVCIDGRFWLPVEPSPGYPIPYSTHTAWQWITAQAVVFWNWVLKNPISVALLIGFISLAILYRAEWITSLMFGWWFLVQMFWPQRLLKATRQLIDLRFWFAGDQRPPSETIDFWYTRVESKTTGAFFRLWNARNYSENTTPASHQELVMACRKSVNSLSLKRIKDFQRSDETKTPFNNVKAIG